MNIEWIKIIPLQKLMKREEGRWGRHWEWGKYGCLLGTVHMECRKSILYINRKFKNKKGSDAQHHMAFGNCKLKQWYKKPIRMAKIWNTDNTKYQWGCGTRTASQSVMATHHMIPTM